MRIGGVLSAGGLLSAVCIAGLASAAEPAADPLAALVACRAIAADADRLACFDAESARLEGQRLAGEVAVIDAARVAALETEAFGFALPSLPDLGPASAPREPLREVGVVIASVRDRGDGKLVFTLENGQVWRQTDSVRNVYARAGAEAEIRRAALGSYMMSFERGGSALRVRREE